MNPKSDSKKLADFIEQKKKTHFELRFRMFRAHGVEIWGSIKHPAAYIYIYIYIHTYVWRGRKSFT